MTWHIDPTTATAYLDRDVDSTTAAAVEAHLVACAACRTVLYDASDPALETMLAGVWSQIDDVLDRRPMGVIERMLQAAGCSETTARIITVSSRARWSYLSAVVLTVALAFAASHSGREEVFGTFLVLAPVGPLLATAAAFGRWDDPAQSLLGTLPVSRWRMTLVRTAASVLPSIVLTAISVPILEERGWLAAAWLLPALALATSTLALATWITIEPATLAVALAWLATPITLRLRSVDLVGAIGGRGQIVAIAVTVAAALIFTARHETFDRAATRRFERGEWG